MPGLDGHHLITLSFGEKVALSGVLTRAGHKLWRNVQHESGVRSTGLALWSETR